MISKYGQEDDVEACQYYKIGPTQTSIVQTTYSIKKYKVVNRKGLISKDMKLYPFGFK
jgi:hypothetical protein